MPAYQVECTRAARDALATLHLKYRGSSVARAESAIAHALETNPQGGFPISGQLWMVVVHPLRAIYRIETNRVVIVEFHDAPPGIVKK